MVKKAISGKGRKGAPPLPRQRGALRVVQVTLLLLAALLGSFAADAFYASASSVTAEVVVLAACAVLCALTTLWMGIGIVRGPRPPELE